MKRNGKRKEKERNNKRNANAALKGEGTDV